MQQIQRDIAQALQVQPPFQSEADVQAQIARRIAFIQQCLKDSGLKTLVLGISGGVDSLTAGLLAQRAVEQLREQTGDQAYRFIAVRLPYQVQQDEADAQASLATIRADEEQTVNIGPSVKALAEQLEALEGLEPAKSDFVIGNIKARIRMVAQYAIAGARGGLVIGTDHAAEAVMGFFTKFGDGACDLAPLSGLAMVHVAGWSLAQGWLLWSLGLYVFAGLCWLPVVWLQIRVRDMAEAALREARPIEPLAYRYMNAWFILGWPAFIAFMVIFYLMVNKPV